MSITRVFLNGCNGRMGTVITGICAKSEDITITAGCDINGVTYTYPVYTNPADCLEEFDVIIDFSNVKALPSVIALSEKSEKPLVMCTTGLGEDDKSRLYALSEKTAVFYSGNMSLGINILISLVRKAAEVLYPDFDIEIVEAHHNQKLDAPSGTALMIADAVNETLDHKLEYVYDRHNDMKKRGKKELGIHSIRGGTIVGEHSVLFAGPEEVITVSHRAESRNVFAQGAVAAAKFMNGKPAGLYDMQDLIGQ